MSMITFGSTFEVQSTTVAQPLVGSWVTAGLSNPSDSALTLTLGTASASGNDATNIFGGASYAMSIRQAVLVDPAGGNREVVNISAVSGNTITLGVQTTHELQSGRTRDNPVTRFSHVSGAFGTGTFIIPFLEVNNILVFFEDGATGQWLYLGNSLAMTALSHSFAKIAKVASGVQPISYTMTNNSPSNSFDTDEFMVLGTTVGDTYRAAFSIV